MRSAPAVATHLHGSRRWSGAAFLLGAVASAAFGATIASHAGAGLLVGACGICGMALAGGAAAWRLRPLDRGHLRWDGQQWWFRADAPAEAGGAASAEQAGTLHVMIDTGHWMLLGFTPRLDTAGLRWPRRAWLPVSAAHLPQGPGLRAAAYGRALNPEPSGPGGSETA